MAEIVPLGVAALKIEGRYKDADYVALVTAAYRKALDDAWAGRAGAPSAPEQLQLAQVYSRGWARTFCAAQTIRPWSAAARRAIAVC